MQLIYRNSSKISDELINKNANNLIEYTEYLKGVAEEGGYDKDEASINLPFDDEIYVNCCKIKDQKVSNLLKHIIVIGIGGSNLGTKAVYDAVQGYASVLEKDRFPKIIFVDTNDTNFLLKLKDFITFETKDPQEIIVNTISKSGGTTETMANTEFIMDVLREKFGEEAKKRLVVTTNFDSKLWKEAEEEDISLLGIPEKVGGRYSVFSTVGIFPLMCLGLDVKRLLEGAKEMRNKCLNDNLEDNPAMTSSIVLYENWRKEKTINDNFVFEAGLKSLGEWYRQLMGESLGKEKDNDGNVVNVGITPTVSVGSTDLHSVGQLYLGGPKDKVTTFIYSETVARHADVPKERIFPNIVEMINGKSMKQIMKAVLEGVKSAYLEKELPFMEVALDDISEYSMGEFLQFKMMEMMYMGKLLNVNPFDQPNVESYKVETKNILEA